MNEEPKTDQTDDEVIDGERGIPSVTKKGGNQNAKPAVGVVIALLGLIGAGALWFYWPEDKKEESALLPARVDQAFDRERITQFDIPELPDEPVVDKSESNPIQANTSVVVRPEPSAEELAAQQAAADLRERRKRSPLVIFDALSNQATKTVDADTHRQEADKKQRELLASVSAINGNNQAGNTLSLGGQSKDSLAGQLGTGSTREVSARLMKDPQYLMGQGKMIGAVIETAISSDLPGMVRAIVSETVYSETGDYVLVEKGSRVIGQYRAGLVQGQGRIFVVWERIITAGGIDIQIDSPGTSPLGLSGHDGWIDTHFYKRFGASVLLSIVGAAAAQADDSQFNVEIGESFNESAELALENSINIRPTLHKNQGDRIKIFVARDINFRTVMALKAG